MMTGSPAGPLDGITVLDLCSYLAGPYGCTLLADLGATRDRLSPTAGDQSAPRLCRTDGIRRPRAAQRQGWLRPGTAVPERHGGVPGRRSRQAAIGAGLGTRLFHLGVARLWRRRRVV